MRWSIRWRRWAARRAALVPKVHVGFAPDGAISVSEAADGHDAWIVKFRATGDPVDIGPVEEAYARMARAAGLTIANPASCPSATDLAILRRAASTDRLPDAGCTWYPSPGSRSPVRDAEPRL